MTTQNTTTERPTASDALAGAPTWPVLSQNRQRGVEWYERMMRQASACANDAARFISKLEES